MSRIARAALIGILLAGGAAVVFAFQPPPDPQPSVTPLGADGQVDPDALYDPFLAGEDLPDGYRAVLDRDDIRPVYDPTFISGVDADWDDELLVIGVTINGDSRAYPVGYLNRREMVIDEVGGEPILVSW